MKLRFTQRADKDYAELPVAVRKAFGKQLRFLLGKASEFANHRRSHTNSGSCRMFQHTD